jgi:hypothetical protein
MLAPLPVQRGRVADRVFVRPKNAIPLFRGFQPVKARKGAVAA